MHVGRQWDQKHANVTLILMVTFVCNCIRLCVELKYVGTNLLRFFLSLVLVKDQCANQLEIASCSLWKSSSR